VVKTRVPSGQCFWGGKQRNTAIGKIKIVFLGPMTFYSQLLKEAIREIMDFGHGNSGFLPRKTTHMRKAG
jgi:hypothetical protein